MRWTSRRIFRWLVRTYNVYSNNVLPPFVLSTSSFNKHTHARCHHFIRRNTFTASFSLSSLPHFNELRSWKPFFRLIVNMAHRLLKMLSLFFGNCYLRTSLFHCRHFFLCQWFGFCSCFYHTTLPRPLPGFTYALFIGSLCFIRSNSKPIPSAHNQNE